MSLLKLCLVRQKLMLNIELGIYKNMFAVGVETEDIVDSIFHKLLKKILRKFFS